MRKTITATLIAAAAVALACSSAPDEPAIPADVAADAGITSPQPTATTLPAGSITAGTWEVGTEVKPGTYLATAVDHCYWARLSSFDGDLGAIIANGNLDPGQRGRITVKKSDKGLELTGDCVWVKDRK